MSKIILCFVSTFEKTLAIKSTYRSVYQNLWNKNKIHPLPISVFLVSVYYKTMTRQIVYLNNFPLKNGFRLQFLRQSTFYTKPPLERSDDLSS